jgi:hypothetical protein
VRERSLGPLGRNQEVELMLLLHALRMAINAEKKKQVMWCWERPVV